MERPKRGEDEDELLRFQEEFLASKNVPSASLVKKADKRRPDNEDRDVVQMDASLSEPSAGQAVPTGPAKKSRFRADRDGRKTKDALPISAAKAGHNSVTPDMDPEELMDRYDKGMAAVLTSIIERDTRNAAFTLPSSTSKPFPSVMERVDTKNISQPQEKKQSLFARQFEQNSGAGSKTVIQTEEDKMDISECGEPTESYSRHAPRSSSGKGASGNLGDFSHIVDGKGLSASQADVEARSIHEENMSKLAEMSEEDILAEQQKLLQMLDPGLVEFLRSKSRKGDESKREVEPQPASSVSKGTPKPGKTKNRDPESLPEVIGVKDRESWVHMDKVEYDKLEWMKDLPAPSAGSMQTGVQARFDFRGNVVPADADIPIVMALHHHGDEPERAGYTLEELFQLARSSNVQQRTLALSTLGHIIEQAKAGNLDEYIQTPILPSILDGGVIFLIRWACDDSVPAVVSAAVSALRALICSPADEAALQMTSSWYQGLAVPALAPAATIKKQEEERNGGENDENQAQETDADVAKRDLIEALVNRMLLLQRLYYILEAQRPQAPTVLAVLQILTRVARHSTQIAYEIARSAKLMSLIVKEFLPTTWKSYGGETLVSDARGLPLPAAMRLVGCLCQAGRNIAASLLATCSLQEILLRYLAVKTQDLQLQEKEAESLQRESFITWRILLSYGFAFDVYLDLYTFLVNELRTAQSALSNLDVSQPQERAANVASVFETVLPIAAVLPGKPSFNQEEGGGTQEIFSTPLNWSHVEGVMPMIKMCSNKWLQHLADRYPSQKPDLQFPTTCLNFLATYFTKCSGQTAASAVNQLQHIEEICSESLISFLKSFGFQTMLAKLCHFSNILSPPSEKRQEKSPCLPELDGNKRSSCLPVLGPQSPVAFLTALFRLVYTLCKVHKGIITQTTVAVIHHQDTVSYLKKLSLCPASHLYANHFTKFENLMQYYLIKLSTLAPCPHQSVMHQVALHLVARLQGGEEFLAHDLFSHVLFNADLIPETRDEELTATSLAGMQISESHILKSATQEEVNTSNAHLLQRGLSNLPEIRAQYFRAFAGMEKSVSSSRFRYQQIPQETTSLLILRGGESLLPRDWVFMPLVQLYNHSGSIGVQSKFSQSLISLTASALQWIFILELLRSQTLSGVSITLKISRVMCVFLAGNDLFLERAVYQHLASLFRCYTTPTLMEKIDFEEDIPGISSFYDLYMLFLDQFEAVSFGDMVFSSYVLLPMQQKQNHMLRRAVWQERPHLLRILAIPVQELLIDIQRYLTPDETDPQLIQLYTQALLSKSVQPTRSPVLFLVAVHHTNRFLYYTQNTTNQQIRQRLWEWILRCKDEDLQRSILYYKMCNTQMKNSMELYTDLPATRQKVLQEHQLRMRPS